MISQIDQLEEITMTTNGVLLPQFAGRLKKAGLKRVNISLDSVSDEQYSEITGGGSLKDVLEGIQAARIAGLTPIKINVVVPGNSHGGHVGAIKKFAAEEGLEVRFISQMDLKTGGFSQVEGGDGGNCLICNRLRLTANGMVKPCLFSNREFSIKKYGTREAFLLALKAKPQKGIMNSSNNFYNIGG
jgi:GTP 3',8-cyclase